MATQHSECLLDFDLPVAKTSPFLQQIKERSPDTVVIR
jgi:hypothetical protein